MTSRPASDPTASRRPRHRRGRLRLAIAAALLAVSGAIYHFFQVQLPHFREVEEGVLYRGGQPRGLGLAYLRLHGIRTVVNLRDADAEGSDEMAAYAAANGLRYHAFTLGIGQREARAAIVRFLTIVDDPENRPVLVHCSRGKERCGVAAAAYRVTRQGWGGDEAFAEAEALGLSPAACAAAQRVIRRSASRGGRAALPSPPDDGPR